MSEVFNDTFEGAGSPTDIASWPSGGADWAYALGSSGLNVQTSGLLTFNGGNNETIAKVIDSAGGITGDQKNTFVGMVQQTDSFWWRVCARINATPNFYFVEFQAGDIHIYRYDGGSYTLLATAARSLADNTRYDTYLQASGTGATVSLEAKAGATAVLTYGDTSGSRITSGVPGLGCYGSDTTYGAQAFTVDDLISGQTISVTDSGSGADSIASLAVSLAIQDSGVGVDAGPAPAVGFTINDSGSAADALLVAVAAAISDAGIALDALSVSASIAVADSGAGTDSPTIAVNFEISDVGAGTELLNVLTETLISIADAGAGTDEIAVSVSIPVADAGVGIDQISLAALLQVIESASGTDVVIRFDVATRIAIVTFSLACRSVAFALASRRIDFAFAALQKRTIDFALTTRSMAFALARREIAFQLN